MLKSRLFDYSDPYVFFKGNVTLRNTEAAGVAANHANKKVILRSCAPFTSCISTTNKTQVDDPQYSDEVMLRYNLIVRW